MPRYTSVLLELVTRNIALRHRLAGVNRRQSETSIAAVERRTAAAREWDLLLTNTDNHGQKRLNRKSEV